MSNSLNRMSLELVNLEIDTQHGKKKSIKQNRSKSVLDLIPANYTIVKKTKKSKSLVPSSQYRKLTACKDKKRLAENKDSTEENIHRLLLLSGHHIDSAIADKLISRAINKRPILQHTKVEKEESTAFSEEDFAKFAEDYFNN